MKGGDAAVALWHDTRAAWTRSGHERLSSRVAMSTRPLRQAQSRSHYAAAVMSSPRMSRIYEMPVLPLIFDTILGLGATKPRAMCP